MVPLLLCFMPFQDILCRNPCLCHEDTESRGVTSPGCGCSVSSFEKCLVPLLPFCLPLTAWELLSTRSTCLEAATPHFVLPLSEGWRCCRVLSGKDAETTLRAMFQSWKLRGQDRRELRNSLIWEMLLESRVIGQVFPQVTLVLWFSSLFYNPSEHIL